MAKKKKFEIGEASSEVETPVMDEEETTSVEDAITEIDADEGQPEEIPEDWQKLIRAFDNRTFENQKEIALICDTANKTMQITLQNFFLIKYCVLM